MATKAATVAEAGEAREEAAEGPLLDVTAATIKKMMARGKERAYVEADDGDGNEARASGNLDDEDIGRTDDPVRMYLREMGSVELLSREGEIAIAKRIEAGRDMMIGGICENPLTVRALLLWRDALNENKMLLRDIIDLDATYGNAILDEAEAAIAKVVAEVGVVAGDGEAPEAGEEPAAESEEIEAEAE